MNLFIDSGRKVLSVALSNGKELLFVSNVNSYSKHSNYLMKEIINILEKANITLDDIDNIIVLNGPGSFTGIRVGVTIAKTLAWVKNKKLYVLNNLEALKVGIKNDVVISVIYDKDNNSYVGVYDDKVLEDYMSLDDINITNKNITIVSLEESNYLLKLKDKLTVDNNVSVKIIDDYDYINVINYAIKKGNINPHLAKPIYLKKIDAEKR